MPGSYGHKKTRQSVHTEKAEAWQVYYLYNRMIDSYLQAKNMSLLRTNKLSSFITHQLSGFDKCLGGAYETDKIVTGGQNNEIYG
ncbi:MAG: hypothetical protein U9R66_14615, partial [Thermodesulfobacteriota bacterium]|nr:hypothetical protein [Thermodesulfobacteriota bacterium]